MGLYENWFKKAYTRDGKINNLLWDEYIPQEQKVYEYLLENKVTELSGTIKELADKFKMTPEYVTGLIDGLNDTQVPPINLENIDENQTVSIHINFEVLYKKMVEYKADHLYTLPQWDHVFTEEERKNFYKSQKSSTTVINSNKVGRNDLCPCGSGKKYKRCCGVR